jgi:hypothetical protein
MVSQAIPGEIEGVDIMVGVNRRPKGAKPIARRMPEGGGIFITVFQSGQVPPPPPPPPWLDVGGKAQEKTPCGGCSGEGFTYPGRYLREEVQPQDCPARVCTLCGGKRWEYLKPSNPPRFPQRLQQIDWLGRVRQLLRL